MTGKFALAYASSPPIAGYQPTPDQVAQVRANRSQSGGNGNAPSSTNDPMLKRSTDIAAMTDYWDKVDTIIDGIAGFRQAGDKYLPRFTDETGNEFDYRLKMTKVTNVFNDIVGNLSLKPFQEEVTLLPDGKKVVPDQLTEFVEDVDGSGNSLTTFSAAVFFNAVAYAVHWIFVDHSKSDPTIVTIADQKKAGVRPYWSHVLARNVLQATSEIINGEEMLTFIRIFEPGAPDHIREFTREPSGIVSWSLYVKVDDPDPQSNTFFRLEDAGTITINTIPMVMFATGRRDGRTFRFFPVLADAADLQVELYQMESGLKFAKTLTAYPMLAANGIRPIMESDGKTPKRVSIGPNKVLYASPNETGKIGKWEFIEPSATSLTFLAQDIKDTISELRELGKQPLTSQAGLTVITTAVAAGKANSAVKAWALTLKNALENALVTTDLWLNLSADAYDPTVRVFTEFDDFTDGKDVDALNAARYPTNGAAPDISRETYWSELQRRGILSPEFNTEDEEAALLAELPSDGPDANPDDDPPDPPPLPEPNNPHPADDPENPGNSTD